MATAQSNVTVNISANTADLDAKLAKQEAAIKTLDGAINILGGSVELAASAIVATGIASEENAEQFQAAALGAIAFADGSKRVLDGVKTLNEGLKGFGGAMKAARAAQVALNRAILANPYIAAAAAVAALAAGIYLLSQRETEEEAANRKALETAKARLQNLEDSEQRVLAFGRAQGIANETLLEFAIASNVARVAELDRIIALEEDNEKITEYYAEQNKLLDKGIELNLQLGNLRESNRQKEIEAGEKTSEKAAEKAAKDQEEFEKFKEREAEKLAAYDRETKELARQLTKQQEERDKAAKIREQREREVRQRLAYDSIKLQQDQAKRDAIYNKEIESNFVLRLKNSSANLNDFFESEAAEAISAGLGIASQFTSILLQAQDDSTEKAFEASKKYKIASVVTSAAQSSFEAFASAQKLNAVVPGLGTLLGVALVGAITVASNKAIADINSATFQQSGGGGATTFTSAGNVNFGGGGIPGASQQGGFLALAPPTTSAPPIRAYVVTGDVTDGIEAEQQLQTRRQFGPG